MLDQRFHHQLEQVGDLATRRDWVSKLRPDLDAREVDDVAKKPERLMIHTTHFEVRMKRWSAGLRPRLLLKENATPTFEKKSMTPVTHGGILEEYRPPPARAGVATRKRKREEMAGPAPAPPADGRGRGGGFRVLLVRSTAPPAAAGGGCPRRLLRRLWGPATGRSWGWRSPSCPLTR